MMIRYATFFLMIISMAGIIYSPASAESGINNDELTTITIDKAIDTALQNNSEYRIAKQKVAETREKVNQVWGALMPILESEASMLRQGAENGFMSLSDGQYDIRIVQLKFAINPGMFYYTLKQSYDGYSLAETELRRIKNEVEYNIIKSYFDAMLAREMANLRKNSIQVLKENLKDVQRLYQTGSVPKFELLQAEVQYKNQETLLLEAEYSSSLAIDMFNYQMGYDKAVYDIDRASIEKDNVKIPAGDEAVAKLIDESIKNRPEVLQVTAQKDMVKHSAKTYQSTYLWPTFSLVGGYGKTYLLPNEVDVGLGPVQPDFSQLTGTREWQDTWQVRLAATYRWGSLFPVDLNRALEREQREKLKEADERLSQVKRLTSISIRANFAKLRTAYETIQNQKVNMETAAEGLRIARESYNAGVIKNADLLNAELLTTQSRTGFIKSVYDYYLSRASLTREVGKDINSIIFTEAKSE